MQKWLSMVPVNAVMAEFWGCQSDTRTGKRQGLDLQRLLTATEINLKLGS